MKVESLFISDIHLGNPNSNPDKLLAVLKELEFNNLFIVGDFIDMTYLKRKFYWRPNHSLVIQKILKLSRKGCKVVYIIGNHDFYVRSLIEEGNLYLGDILLCDEYIHNTLSGEKIYITHGDQFDGFVRIHPLIYWLGDKSYELSIKINKVYNFFRIIFGLEYWSLSSYLKSSVKNVVKFLSEYKKMANIKLKEKECDSLLMGHTHSPEIIQGEYYNTGDFCESNTYIVEHIDGKLELIYIK